MAFRFRLEKVLVHRRRLEDEAKREFIIAQAATNKALSDLEALYVAIDVARSRGHEMQVGTSDHRMAPTLQNIDSFINGQKIRIERQRAVIRDLKSTEERMHELLVEASKEKKTLEKLREKHLEEYRAELARKEQAELDDLAIMRFGRGEGPV
jgi:flagellar FliJ protein